MLPGADGASSQIPFAAAPARREKDHQELLADRGRDTLPLRRSFDPSFVRSSSPVLEEEPVRASDSKMVADATADAARSRPDGVPLSRFKSRR